MRPWTLSALVLVLVAALALVTVVARAEDAPRPPGDDLKPRVEALEHQVQALVAETALLRSREAALTKYVVSLQGAAGNLRQMASQARAEGFEAAAIPAAARQTVLRGIDQLASDLSKGLPQPTDAEKDLARKAEQLRKEAK